MKLLERIGAGRLDGNFTKGRDADGMLPPEAFRALIERECGRSDRNAHCFSLVTFRFGEDGRRSPVRRQLIHILRRRMRCTDEAGWLAATELGVILPDTRSEGARMFRDYVCREMKSSARFVGCRLYTYPSDAWGRKTDPEQLWFDHIVAAEDRSPFFTARMAGQRLQEEAASGSQSSEPSESGQHDEGMEKYLVVRPPVWKRSLDIAGSVILLAGFAPLMLLIAAYIKCVSRGPVLFRQERVGLGGRRFACLKFRTMHVVQDVDRHREHLSTLIRSAKPMTKLDDKQDTRIIPFGRVLRYSGLDELPQLLNVLLGDMSLVWPRPCIPYEFDEYDAWQRRRVQAMPGLTGLWQVSGKNRTTFVEMIRMDLAYVRRASLRLDIAIALKTVPAIVGQVRDAYGRWTRKRAVEYA